MVKGKEFHSTKLHVWKGKYFVRGLVLQFHVASCAFIPLFDPEPEIPAALSSITLPDNGSPSATRTCCLSLRTTDYSLSLSLSVSRPIF